jgi:CRISPR-associated exonuclease Cas4
MSNTTTNKKSFKEFIEANFIKTMEQKSVSSLGDRSKYVGASDIGGCPFKTIKSKLTPKKYDIKQHIVFQRGHIAEKMVESMFNGLPYDKQVCLEGEMNNFPLKAHLDFLIEGKNRKIVAEAKTVDAPIKEPMEAWILQVQFQMGLLINQLQDENIQVEGKIIAVNVNTGWYEAWDVEFCDDIFELCLSKADHLTDCLQNGVEPKAIIQNYCGTCPFVMECPKQGLHAIELPEDLKEALAEIKAFKAKEKEIKTLETKIKEYLVNTGTETAKVEGEINAVVKCKESQSNRFDTNKFKADHPELYKEYVKSSSSFRMTIS